MQRGVNIKYVALDVLWNSFITILVLYIDIFCHDLFHKKKLSLQNFCSLTVHSYIIYRDINQKAIEERLRAASKNSQPAVF